MITGTSSPVDPQTLAPVPGSPVLGAAVNLPAAMAGHPVRYQLDELLRPVRRAPVASGSDLGAIEQ